MNRRGLQDVEKQLEGLDWAGGLTRDDIRQAMPNLPQGLYLDLPASKRFRNPVEVMHEALNAPNRAEGEVVRQDFDAFDSEGAEEDGGPVAWGKDPIIGPHEEAETA